MRSSRLRGGLGGSGVNPSVKGDKIVVGGVVVMFSERIRMVLQRLDTVVFKGARRLITVGCF